MALYRHKFSPNDKLRSILAFSDIPKWKRNRPIWAANKYTELYEAHETHEVHGEYIYEVSKSYLHKFLCGPEAQIIGLELRDVKLKAMYTVTLEKQPIPAKELLVCNGSDSMKLVFLANELERIEDDK